jgi:three-Cys-motif partner protein
VSALRYDKIGNWSEIKLEIIRKYAVAYSTIMARQSSIRKHIYIDGFSGPGVHISKLTGEFIPGSPTNALLITPPFREFHFIDIDGDKAAELRKIVAGRTDVQIYEGDCNEILTAGIFPSCRWDKYVRALCLLDPYGIHLNWSVLKLAGQMETIETFLNFPVMDMNMNVLLRNPEKAAPEQVDRMNVFWGDFSWQKAAYSTEQNLFNFMEKTDSDIIVEAFRERLKTVAGFKYVPSPLPMRNSKGSILYYLFFASPSKTGNKIIEDIFSKYRRER